MLQSGLARGGSEAQDVEGAIFQGKERKSSLLPPSSLPPPPPTPENQEPVSGWSAHKVRVTGAILGCPTPAHGGWFLGEQAFILRAGTSFKQLF